MKAVIPVKASSLRVANKNFRDFHRGQSLLDITLAKVVPLLGRENVFVSCEDPSKQQHTDKWGVNFIVRDPVLADNDTPFFDVFNGICADVPGEDDIAWCQVIDPLFDQYSDCFRRWSAVREKHDSLVVVYPIKQYFLDQDFVPQGFGFAADHIKSQHLPLKYHLTFTLSVLTREAIRNQGYYVGANPHWYCANTHTVDIDTQSEFEFAGKLYSLMFENTDEAK